jgi:hypothetical protein
MVCVNHPNNSPQGFFFCPLIFGKSLKMLSAWHCQVSKLCPIRDLSR